MSTHILSVSEAQAKLHGGRCPFCHSKPKVEKQRGEYLSFRGFCEHLWATWGYGAPEVILAQPRSWQGPGWPFWKGLPVSASGADRTGMPAPVEL